MTDTHKTPEDTTTDSIGSRVDLLCDRFEVAWKSSQRPRIEEYLDGIAEPNRSRLLHELILLDVHYRVRAGEQPDREEYLAGYPDASDVIIDAIESIHTDAHIKRTQPTAVLLEPNAQLGDYELLEELGRGGMGVVFRARQKSADRIVALKVIRDDHLAAMSADRRKQIVERFNTEARSAARLEHDHLVTVYDVGEVAGRHYYSMRFVKGQDLAEIVANGPIENRRAARYIQAAAGGVHEAHRHSVLHRDLKPANILIDTESDRALVTDFGLARLYEGDSEMTGADDLIGSPSYMSPEQATSAASVTAATDIYALGATLYHLISGRPPFQAGTIAQTLDQVRSSEVVAPRELNPNIDRDLETICLKCLEKEPTRRYESAIDLADDLQRYRNHEPILARPVGVVGRLGRWRRRNPAIAILALSVAVVLIVGTIVSSFFAYQADQRAEETGVALTAVEQQKEIVEEKRDEALAAKQESDRQAYLAMRTAYNVQMLRIGMIWRTDPQRALRWLEDDRLCPPDQRDFLWRFMVNQIKREPMRIELSDARVTQFDISPAGQRIAAACTDGNVRTYDIRTRTLRRTIVVQQAGLRDIVWSPDGSQLATAGNAVCIWNADTGERIALLNGHDGVVHAIDYSWDGALLASGGSDARICIWDAATGEPKQVLDGPEKQVNSLQFSPHHDAETQFRSLAAACDDGTVHLWKSPDWQEIAVLVDPRDDRRCPKSPPWPVENESPNFQNGFATKRPEMSTVPISRIRYSPDGRRIASIDGSGLCTLWELAPDGGSKLTEQPDLYALADIAWYPNGLTLVPGIASPAHAEKAYVIADAGEQKELGPQDNRLGVFNPATGIRRPTSNGSVFGHVCVSPGGRMIVSYVANRDHLLLWDGRGIYESEYHSLGYGARNDIMLPGKIKYAVRVERQDDGLRFLPKNDDGKTATFVGGDVTSYALSADSKTVATMDHDFEVRLWNLDTGTQLREVERVTIPANAGIAGEFLNGGMVLKFSPEGKWLAGTKTRNGYPLWVWNVLTGKLIMTSTCSTVQDFTFSPDSKLLAVATGGDSEVWSCSDWTLKVSLEGRFSRVENLAFSHGEGTLVARHENTLTFWDVETGLERGTIDLRPRSMFHELAFSGDDSQLCTTDGILLGGVTSVQDRIDRALGLESAAAQK